MTELLTTKEACSFLKIGRQTLLKYVRSKELSGCKIGRSWRFEKSAIEQWLRTRIANNKTIKPVGNKTS